MRHIKHQISLSLKFIKNFSQKYCSSSSERLSKTENSAGLHQMRKKNICICRITILVCSSARDKIWREDRKLQETDQDTCYLQTQKDSEGILFRCGWQLVFYRFCTEMSSDIKKWPYLRTIIICYFFIFMRLHYSSTLVAWYLP